MTAKHLVAFIDILGFSNYVITHSSEEVYTLLNSFNEAASVVKDDDFSFNYNITVFSDNVVISTPFPETQAAVAYHKFLLAINHIQLNVFLQCHQPIRGGITIDEFYTSQNLLFGKALIDAYQAENKYAVSPRILVMSNIITPEKSKAAAMRAKEVFAQMNKLDLTSTHNDRNCPVVRDTDGMLFCNYLSSTRIGGKSWAKGAFQLIDEHRKLVVQIISEYEDNVNLFKKYYWMKTYHNWFCLGYDELNTYLINL